jgi:hypothetical protein
MADAPSVIGIRSAAGAEMPVINISRGGVLLQTRRRMAPGTRIHLELDMVGGVIRVAGFVVRSPVCSATQIPRYRAAVAFDSPLWILAGYPRPLNFPAFSKPYVSLESAVSAAILAFRIQRKSSDPLLHEMLSLNTW